MIIHAYCQAEFINNGTSDSGLSNYAMGMRCINPQIILRQTLYDFCSRILLSLLYYDHSKSIKKLFNQRDEYYMVWIIFN